MAKRKNESVWLVTIGLVFMSIIVLLMLVPHSYFRVAREGFYPEERTSMGMYLNRNQELPIYDSSFASGFQSALLLPSKFSDGDALFIARRCYQFTDLSVCSETDPTQKKACNDRYSSMTNEFTNWKFNTIGSSIDTVVAYFDSIARGEVPAAQMLCKTMRVVSSNFAEIRQRVIADVQSVRDRVAAPLRGSVYTMFFQVPYWRSPTNDVVSVMYNAASSMPYNDLKNVNTRQSEAQQAASIVNNGPILYYIVTFYGGYDRSYRALDFDAMEGIKLNPRAGGTSGASYLLGLDAVYHSKDDRCTMECISASDIYCGCASMPSITKNNQPYYVMSFPDKADTAYSTNLSNMYNGTNVPGVITNNLPRFNTTSSAVYQAKCLGPQYPLGYQKKYGMNTSTITNRSMLSTFGVLYRINPFNTLLPTGMFDQTAPFIVKDPTAASDE